MFQVEDRRTWSRAAQHLDDGQKVSRSNSLGVVLDLSGSGGQADGRRHDSTGRPQSGLHFVDAGRTGQT